MTNKIINFNKTIVIGLILGLVAFSAVGFSRESNAAQAYDLKNKKKPSNKRRMVLVWESRSIGNAPIHLMKAADLNGNGIKELVVTNFSNSMEGQRKYSDNFQIAVYEWTGKKYEEKWRLEIPEAKYMSVVGGVTLLASWRVGKQDVIQGVPPYIGLQWAEGKYQWHEQSRFQDNNEIVGSWAMPWISPSCWGSFTVKRDYVTRDYPRECFMALRHFEGQDNPVIISFLEKTQGICQIRVRRYDEDYLVIWESDFKPGIPFQTMIDFDERARGSLLLSWNKDRFVLRPNQNGGYKLEPTSGEIFAGFFREGNTYQRDLILGHSKSPNVEEYWGEFSDDNIKPESEFVIRRAFIIGDILNWEDLKFNTHKKFHRTGTFALGDLDSDGLDEIALIEYTGNWERPCESCDYINRSNVADYLNIVKWGTDGYKRIWSSKPYEDGVAPSSLLIDKLARSSKKQLIVGTDHGTVQIWEYK